MKNVKSFFSFLFVVASAMMLNSCYKNSDGEIFITGPGDWADYCLKISINKGSLENVLDDKAKYIVDSNVKSYINSCFSRIYAHGFTDKSFLAEGEAEVAFADSVVAIAKAVQPILDSLVAKTGHNDFYVTCSLTDESQLAYPKTYKTSDPIRPTKSYSDFWLIRCYTNTTTNAKHASGWDEGFTLYLFLDFYTYTHAETFLVFNSSTIQSGFEKYYDSVKTDRSVQKYLQELDDSVYVESQFLDESGNVIKLPDGTPLSRRFTK